MTDTPFDGIEFKTMPGLSDNMLYILGPSQIASIDTVSGVSAILPYEDVHAGFARHIGDQLAKQVRFEGEPKTVNYSVAQHTFAMTNLCREIDMTPDSFHDILEREENRLRQRLAAKQEQILRNAVTSTTAETAKPYSLEQLEAEITTAQRLVFDNDQKLIEAMLAAGCNVMQGEHSGQPTVVLPAEMDGARKEVVRKRANRDAQENFYRDSLSFWGARLDMRP